MTNQEKADQLLEWARAWDDMRERCVAEASALRDVLDRIEQGERVYDVQLDLLEGLDD